MSEVKKTACGFCKRRKIKCDRREPCSSCTRYGNVECIFESHPRKRRSKRRVLENEVNELRSKVMQLQSSVAQTGPKASSGITIQDFSSLSPSMSSVTDMLENPLQGSLGNPIANSVSTHNPCNLGSNNYASGYAGRNNSTSAPSGGSSDPSLYLYSDRSPTDSFSATTPEESDACIGLDDEIKRLLKGKDYEFNLYEGHSFFSSYEPKRGTFGPFGWRGLCEVDPFLKTTVEYMCSVVNFSEGSCPFTVPSSEESQLLMEHLSDSAKATGKKLGLNFQFPYTEDIGLISKIEIILPDRDIIWELIDIYFEYVYVFSPFADELDFRMQIKRIIGDRRGSSRVSFKSTDKLDLAIIGILLIILRLTYISLLSGGNDGINYSNVTKFPVPTERLNRILNNPVNVEVANIAQECFETFDIYKTTLLSVMQLGMYILVYKTKGPECGNDTNNGEFAFKAMIVLLAYRLNLHREPVDDVNPKANHLGKKLWLFLAIGDYADAYVYGTPIVTDSYSSDVKNLYFTVYNSNLVNYVNERAFIEGVNAILTKTNTLLKGFLNKLLDVNKGIRVLQLLKNMTIMSNIFSTPNQCQPDNDAQYSESFTNACNIFGLKVILTTKFSNISLYFHIFNFYEKKGEKELSFYFIKKLFKEMLPVLIILFETIQNDVQFLVFITSYVETTIHKLILVTEAIKQRALTYLSVNKSSSDPIVNKFLNSLNAYTDLIYRFINLFSNRTFYSYIIQKYHESTLKLFEDILKMSYHGIHNENYSLMENPTYVGELDEIVSSINQKIRDMEVAPRQDILDNDLENLWDYINTLNSPGTASSLNIANSVLN